MYIGTSPSNGVRRIHTYTATANQTTFTGSSTEGVTLTYADTNYIDVFQNGVLLGSADYTSTSGTSVVLAQGASVSDLVVIVVYDVFSVADTVSKTAGGSFDSGVTMSSTLGVTGALSAKGGAVFNEDSADVDFRVESNGNANMLFVDGGQDRVGISNNNPQATLHIDGSLRVQNLTSGEQASATIMAAANGNSALRFADADDINIGKIDYNHADNSFAFDTNNTERMRIDSAGNVFIGKTAESGTQDGFQFKQSGECIIGRGANDTVVIFQDTNNSGNQVGNISITNSNTAYNTSSDYRLKENVTTSWDATTRLKQLKPSRFNFIIDADKTVDGFLAHEVSSIVPEAITGEKDAVDTDGNAVMQSIDQSKIIPLLVKTIQELEARITALENA